jgi:tetratricopeptide (TPR) repeat protein
VAGRAAWIAVAVIAVGAGTARAQSASKREAGVFGGAPADGAANMREIDECTPPEGLSEAETDARVSEHYDRGRILYSQGDYENAIEEFVAAYCYGRYASILVDIGQAYERTVNYEKAVAYLERYIIDAPDDEQKTREVISYRVEVLRTLPARIRVATVPEGATVTLTGPTGVAAQSPANGEAIVVRKGRYEMRVEMTGYEPVAREVTAEIGQPYSYYFQLQPQRGRLKVIASPSSARIFVNDKLAGIGSYSDTLPIGEYKLTVEAARRAPRTETVEIRANRPTTATIELDDEAKSGRRELLIASTIGGAGFGGGAFATVFGEDSTGTTLGGVLGLGVGFGSAYFGIPDDIEVGTSSYMIGSTLIAASEGALISTLITCSHNDETGRNECADQTIGGIALASGVVGLGFAAATAERFDLTAGDAALINSGAMWGATGGALFWALFDSPSDRPKLGASLVLLGLNAGIAAGVTVASRTDYSRGHVALIDVSGLAGIVAGVALAQSFPEDDGGDSERIEHFALGGMTVGLITGAWLTRNRSKPKSLSNVRAALGNTHDSAGNLVTTFGAGVDF